MEEILASIRRIISEDDAPAEAAQVEAPAEPEAEPVVAQAPEPEAAPEPIDDGVLELTETYEAHTEESIGDLDVSAIDEEPEPFPVTPLSESFPEPASVEVAATPSTYDTLVGDSAAASAASAFAGLASAARRPTEDSPAFAGPTIDELARSLLRPMLKEWLDAHLPAIVEAEVRKEVERIARNAS